MEFTSLTRQVINNIIVKISFFLEHMVRFFINNFIYLFPLFLEHGSFFLNNYIYLLEHMVFFKQLYISFGTHGSFFLTIIYIFWNIWFVFLLTIIYIFFKGFFSSFRILNRTTLSAFTFVHLFKIIKQNTPNISNMFKRLF